MYYKRGIEILNAVLTGLLTDLTFVNLPEIRNYTTAVDDSNNLCCLWRAAILTSIRVGD